MGENQAQGRGKDPRRRGRIARPVFTARRANGFSYHVDPADFERFADGFPFAETEDQAKAIEDVLGDLVDASPMDRLVCGDVGFGKTEVALRAAFVAVTNGRQVAVLVPTTLLAQQHYQTFVDRFADWPINVALLSRFQGQRASRRLSTTSKTAEPISSSARTGCCSGT